MKFHGEVGEMEDLFKGISRKFQNLVQELTPDEVEELMFVLKKEKENLIIVRSLIPTKIQLYHHILTQLDALGNILFHNFCNLATQQLELYRKSFSPPLTLWCK